MTTSMRPWFTAFIVAVFLAGTSIGVVVDRLWLIPRGAPTAAAVDIPDVARQQPPTAPERMAETNLARLQNRLQLKPEQRDRVRPLVAAWQQRIRALQATTREQLRAETALLEQNLAGILTPEQRERLSEARDNLLLPRLAPRGGGARGARRGAGGSTGARGE